MDLVLHSGSRFVVCEKASCVMDANATSGMGETNKQIKLGSRFRALFLYYAGSVPNAIPSKQRTYNSKKGTVNC